MFEGNEVPASARTECTQDSFELAAHFSRPVVAWFDGGAVTSDTGTLLLREVEGRMHLIERLAECFDDRWDERFVRHGLEEMLAQRVYRLALGYQDLNDHEELRRDSLLGVLSGQREAGQVPWRARTP